jgi:DNA-binding NtrC family response regulator
MVMPNGVTGGALARTLQAHSPDLHVICTSGYTPEYIERDLPANDRITFLAKPYLPSRLLEVVRRCLADSQPAQNGNGARPTECPAPV